MESIGLKRGTVDLLPYNNDWKKKFEIEKLIIEKVFIKEDITVNHIGSTSIPGICSKPIIDISISITNFEKGFLYVPLLNKIGYEFKGECNISGRHFFTKGNDQFITHHIHMFQHDHIELKKHFQFRDFLNNNLEFALQYQSLKLSLKEKFSNSREEYTAAKTDFVQKILKLSELKS